MVVTQGSTVVNMAVSTMEVSRSMVVNSMVASNTMVNSRITTMRLSRWSRRACLSCLRCSSAAQSCKGSVGPFLCRVREDGLEGRKDLQGTCHVGKMLIPLGRMNGMCWIRSAVTLYVGSGVCLDVLDMTENGAVFASQLSQ